MYRTVLLQSPSDETLRKVSENWTALLELWTTDSKKPKPAEKWCFALEDCEIATQLQWFTRPHDGNHDEPRNGLRKKELAINFPTSIGNQLDRFSVLCRVFVRKSPYHRPCTDKEVNEEWKILRVPIAYDSSSTFLDLDSLHLKLDNRAIFTTSLPGEYLLYSVIQGYRLFNNEAAKDDDTDVEKNSEGASRNTEHVGAECNQAGKEKFKLKETEQEGEVSYDEVEENQVGKDGHGMNSNNNEVEDCVDFEDDDSEEDDDGTNIDECMATSAAIFSTNDVQSKSSVRLITCLGPFDAEGRMGKYTFHPNLPLMAFHLDEGENRGGSIILWNLSGKSHPRDSPGLKQTVLKLAHLHWTEGLYFSASGEEVVVEMYGSEPPIVIPIQDTALYQTLRIEQDNQQETFSPSSVSGTSSALMASPLSTLSHTQMILHGDQSCTSIDFHPNPSKTNISLIRSNDQCQILQPLLSLPAVPDIRHLNVTVALPQNTEETKLRIILTKAARLFCAMTDSDTDTPSTIVQKDVRALLQGCSGIADK